MAGRIARMVVADSSYPIPVVVQALGRLIDLPWRGIAAAIGVSEWTLRSWKAGSSRPSGDNLGRLEAFVKEHESLLVPHMDEVEAEWRGRPRGRSRARGWVCCDGVSYPLASRCAKCGMHGPRARPGKDREDSYR